MDIPPALVEGLVREQFPEWADLPVRPVPQQGHDNRTFRLGNDMGVRLPSAEGYAPGIGKEDRALPVLTAHVTTRLPEVLATGAPSELFPFPWSVRRWLPGTVPSQASGLDRPRLAEDLGRFLVELRAAPTDGGPACGQHCFFRGCHPSVYADHVQHSLAQLGDRVDQDRCRGIWQDALTTAWPREPVWFHGDVAEGNLLVKESTLSAVIDFGGCGVGDPACDLVIAWTFFGRERDVFRSAVDLDEDTWARARGWALWKALITVVDPAASQYATQQRALENVLTAWC